MPARLLTSLPLLLLALGLGAASLGCTAPPPPPRLPPAPENTAAPRVHVLRLHPGDDLKESLDAYVHRHGLAAVVVLSCVGSVKTAAIRYADRPEVTTLEGKREIVSLVGMLSTVSSSHLHLAVSDEHGVTLGGHLMAGTKVYTTAEIALAELPGLRFDREVDATYGYRELVVRPVK